jgi:putative ABC transport system permease protein
MNIEDTILSAYHSIKSNPMRSFLTILGIIIGVAAVIAMVAVGQGAQYSVQKQIESLGTNVLVVFPGAQMQTGRVRMEAGFTSRLTIEDVEAIKTQCDAVAFATPIVRTMSQVIYGNNNWRTGIYGVNTDYFQIRAWGLSAGNYFTEQDVKAGAKVCVIGQTVKNALFGEEDPIGKIIRIRDVPVKVVGVLEPKGQNVMGQDQDDIIVAPYTTVMSRLSRFFFIGSILVSAVNQSLIPVAQQQITQVLREKHKIQPWQEDDFTVRTQTEIASTAQETSRIMTILLGSIASVSLIVGGIGVMNIMLVSVTERTREIGIRISVGARKRDILFQFLLEAVVLTVTGGIFGIILGVFLSKIISGFAGWPVFISVGAILLAFGFSAGVGIFFGFYPARKAANLNPVEALRYE